MRRIFSLVAVLCACGGGDDGGASDDVSIDALMGETAIVTCAKLAECCTTEEFMDQTLGQSTEAECVALLSGFGGVFTAAYRDSIERDRLVYHADRARACLDNLAALTCAEYAAGRAEDFTALGCEMFEGRVDSGGECAGDVDCVSRWCSGDSISLGGEITYGICGEPPVAKEPCDDFECGDGLWCASGNCEAQKPDGEACTVDDECLSGGCTGDPGLCGVSLVCDGAD